MQYQQWQDEYKQGNYLPTIKRNRPSSSLTLLENYLKENQLNYAGPILDLGCGNGRNSFYFANKGYDVYALDFITESITKNIKDRLWADRIKIIRHTLPEKTNFKSNYFGLILDIVTTISLNESELKKMRAEIYRVLRRGGLFLTYVVSDKNSYQASLKKFPNQKFVLLPNTIKERIWNPISLLKFYDNLTPYFIRTSSRKDLVNGKLRAMEMITALFVK